MDHITIRSYQPDDRRMIEFITYHTGFHGRDLTGRNYFDDSRLFYLLFMDYYTRYEPEHFFVAADNRKLGQAVGFVGGTADSRRKKACFNTRVLPRVALRAFLFTTWRYPRTFSTLLAMTRMLSGIDPGQIEVIEREYPAHLHINIMPGYQSRGIGERLIQHFEDHLRSLGTTGVHLQTSNYNHKAMPFYSKMGYTIAYQTGPVPHPQLDHFQLVTYVKQLN